MTSHLLKVLWLIVDYACNTLAFKLTQILCVPQLIAPLDLIHKLELQLGKVMHRFHRLVLSSCGPAPCKGLRLGGCQCLQRRDVLRRVQARRFRPWVVDGLGDRGAYCSGR
jgi:hypothetical protein